MGVMGGYTCTGGCHYLNDVWRREFPCITGPGPPQGGPGNCPPQIESQTQCEQMCFEGYTISGPAVCLDGAFSEATCTPKSCDVGYLPSNGGLGNCPDTLMSAEWCRIECDKGYTATSL